MLISGKEASDQDGLYSLINSVNCSCPRKNPLPPKAQPQKRCQGSLHTLGAWEDGERRGGTAATAEVMLWGARIKPSLGSLCSHKQLISQLSS